MTPASDHLGHAIYCSSNYLIGNYTALKEKR
ncbi:hypothetical protein FEAC_00370 [Ferrimicrobium acidiphilum DSM 19497]|uniref:Uncharacterized protein n=1 Tax=Ferrimicrobium acidiphilum DSM 19497 TaxID=1121877 RepID=A0A0D8FYX8_9ACTN|nr:hypothetical protein FEAC_00370 [Ferrimicrobium acidiphilum DSM 19497]